MRHEGCIVEFIGLPGVGKSTVAAGVFAGLGRKGIPVCQPNKNAGQQQAQKAKGLSLSKVGSLAFSARAALARPVYALRSVRAILATGQRSRSDLRTLLPYWLMMSERMRQSRGVGGVHLYDQGIVQALWSIGFSSAEMDLSGLADALRTSMPVPDLLVIVKASLPTVERRLLSRPQLSSRLAARLTDEPLLMERAATLMQAVEATVHDLSRQGSGMRVLVLDNERDDACEENTMRVVRAVEELCAPTRAEDAAAARERGLIEAESWPRP